MTSIRFAFRALALSLLAAGAIAQAASVSGTVTNKTTGKPSSGDTVLLIDVQQGMAEVGHATTDGKGKFTLNKPGASPYLVKVMHQNTGYFIAAPQGNAPADVGVYDVSAKVEGVHIQEDVYGVVEAQNNSLHVVERWVVVNTSQPGITQYSHKSFEVILPEDAIVQESSAQRPGGLPTQLSLDPDGPKGHYSFDFPIQPDDGEKHTLFQVEYQIPNYKGKYTFHPSVTIPAHTVWVVLPKSMSVSGNNFKSAPQDPSMQTWVAQDAKPGIPMEVTVSGEGSLPRDNQGGGDATAGGGGSADMMGGGGQPTGQPGGGIGQPIATPDPLSKYKWWILGGLGLLLAAAAAFLLRRPAGAVVSVPYSAAAPAAGSPATAVRATPSVLVRGDLISVLKDELFELETARVSGTIEPADYADVKATVEKLIKYAQDKKKA